MTDDKKRGVARYALGAPLALLLIGVTAYVVTPDGDNAGISTQTQVTRAEAHAAAATVEALDTERAVSSPRSLHKQPVAQSLPIAVDSAKGYSGTQSPFQAELERKFKTYDANIAANLGPMPTWWGNRDLYKDLAAADKSAVVMDVMCAPDMCAVDVYHPHLPAQGKFDMRIANLAAFQGGAYVRRYADDPTKLRVYVFKAELNASADDSYPAPPPEKETHNTRS